MLDRALRSIPYGASTYSKSYVAFGKNAPLYASHGIGWRCFDVNGTHYCDLIMGLGSVILGHCHPEVDESIRRQLLKGTASSLAAPVEIEAAERLLSHFPPLSMVQWATNGTDSTLAAIRLARAVTGRPLIVIAKEAYHGFDDWSLSGTHRGYGIPGEASSPILKVDKEEFLNLEWTSVDSERIAAIIIEPDLHSASLRAIRDWATAHGSLLISDEMQCWQRYPEWTGAAHYGVTPDIWCLGKSLANGMPVSAIVGPKDIMKRFAPGDQPNAFFSSTWAGHPLSMAAVVATLDAMKEQTASLWNNANKLHQAVVAIVSDNELPLSIAAPPFSRITFPSVEYAQCFRRFMERSGVLIYGSHNLSLAHDHYAIARLLEAWQNTAAALRNEKVSTETRDPEIMRR
jgi:glutamate-1-semialdehyde 2,1-aminomutase